MSRHQLGNPAWSGPTEGEGRGILWHYNLPDYTIMNVQVECSGKVPKKEILSSTFAQSHFHIRWAASSEGHHTRSPEDDHQAALTHQMTTTRLVVRVSTLTHQMTTKRLAMRDSTLIRWPSLARGLPSSQRWGEDQHPHLTTLTH